MRTWTGFADTYGTDAALEGLDAEQIRAVIDVLLLVMYADGKATTMEKVELGDALLKLPSMNGKQGVVDAHVEAARERARDADAETIDRVAEAAAAKITDPAAREVVFRMTVALATADLTLALDESAVLTAIATAFGLPQEKAQLVIDETLG